MEPFNSMIESSVKLEVCKRKDGEQQKKLTASKTAIDLQIYKTKTVAKELIEGMKVEIVWMEKENFYDIIKDFKSFGKSMNATGQPAAIVEALIAKPGEWVSVKDLNFKPNNDAVSGLYRRIAKFNESSIHRPIELVLQTKQSEPYAMRLTFRIRETKAARGQKQ